MGVMRELLWKTNDPKAPLRKLEFYRLRLDDLTDSAYRVVQLHGAWHDLTGWIVWEKVETDSFKTLHQARERYVERRLALVERGFIYSDWTRDHLGGRAWFQQALVCRPLKNYSDSCGVPRR
jgi:hypothetical protein